MLKRIYVHNEMERRMKSKSGPAEVTLLPERERVPEDWDNTVESRTEMWRQHFQGLRT